MIALVALSVLSLALLGALIYRERTHDFERRELIDRIQAPDAARAAAFSRAIGATPPEPNTDLVDDARYGRDLDDLTPDFAYIGES